MHSIKSKITGLAITITVIAMLVASAAGIIAIRNLGTRNAEQMLELLCEVGEKNLDAYFSSIEQSVDMISEYVKTDLDGLDDESLEAHVARVSDMFRRMSFKTNGILTYYYRIDPAISEKVKGFWFVDSGEGFKEHEVTDITLYDTSDTSKLVWFTVPKYERKSIWLPPYITDTIEQRVLSYNTPIYYKGTFVGVIGIELDYSEMAEQVDNITLYDNGYAFINDSDGVIIYHPRMDVTTMVTQPSVPKGLLSNDNFVEYNFEGVEKQAIWLPLENGMRLNVSVPVSEINSEWHSWAFNLALAFAILLIAAILVTRRFANHITQPLQELTAVAEQVNEGNYDCSLTYNGDDEVGVLTHAFSRLIAHLKTYIHDLNDLAYADSLTSVHNKGAFSVSMNNLQDAIDKPDSDERFAIVIFDCDNLKEINDQYGHGNGNIYLKTSCSIICNAFRHSPVFRVGGDEFATILKGDDYVRREELLQMFDDLCEDKRRTAANEWEKVSISRGMAVYDPLIDGTSRSVASRADDIMYENKRAKKQQQ